MGKNLQNVYIISFQTTLGKVVLPNLLSNLCVCTLVWLCVCTSACICAHVKSRGHPGMFFLNQFLSFLKHDLSLTWSSSSKLGWLVSSRDLLVFAFLELRVQVCINQCNLAYLSGYWGSRLVSSCLHHVLCWEHLPKKCFWSDNSDLTKWRGAIIILKCKATDLKNTSECIDNKPLSQTILNDITVKTKTK